MILVIDNYDSFTYNLVQALRSLGREVGVVKNDEIDLAGIAALFPEAIVFSPGPGNPDSAGITLAAVKEFAGKVPMLGICLGHQSIAQAFGARIVLARQLMHGKTSRLKHDGRGLFAGLPQGMPAMRYHSLAVERESLPDCFDISAEAEDGEIMGLRHREFPIETLQYHPESIGTPDGIKQLENFLAMASGRVSLPAETAYGVMRALMQGDLGQEDIARVLLEYNSRGISQADLEGSARAMREAGVRVEIGDIPAVDIVGTGGDGHHTFNVSTCAAFIAAGAGVPVAKHGNVAATSKCGAADVLRELGYDLTLAPDRVAECIRQVGVGFLFAKELHPAMRYAAATRKALGCKTIFNLLGPLTNPAGVKRNVIGVYDVGMVPVIAATLNSLGSKRALVFTGEDGLDEISPGGNTFVSELKDGIVTSYLIDPRSLYGEAFPVDDLSGGDPRENAILMRGVLEGKIGGAKRAAAILNAAAAIYVGGRAESLTAAVAKARESVDSGAALEKLERMVAFR